MTKPIDITGHRYGRLLVLSPTGRSANNARIWNCVCDCGKEVEVKANAMRTGNTLSCGCYRHERIGGLNRTHGMSKHPAYISYKAAHTRCTNPRQTTWEHYGGRGIKFLLPPFEEFWALTKDSWFEGASLDRFPDMNGNYEIGNVRWATYEQQASNRRDNVFVTFNGVTKILTEWAAEMGMHNRVLKWRINKWGVERALTTPKGEGRLKEATVTFNGVERSMSEWAALLETSPNNVRRRVLELPLEVALDKSKIIRRRRKFTGDENVTINAAEQH